MRTIDHEGWVVVRSSFSHLVESGLNVFRCVVGAGRATSEDDVDIGVAGGLDDGGHT